MTDSPAAEMTLGALLAQTLAERDMTQSEFARLLAGEDASASRIASVRRLLIKWLQDDHVPSDQSLVRLADALSVPIENLRAAASTAARQRPTERLPTTGDRLGPYRLDGMIGAGAEAAVFSATDVHRGDQVAVKVFWPHLADSGKAHRWVREMEVLADLDHPSITPVLYLGHARGIPFMATRLAESTLAEKARDAEPEVVVDFLSQIASALDTLHDAGMVHRDIKPDNVLVIGRRAYLTDFGMAQLADPDPSSPSSLSSLAYTAPEVIRGEGAERRADIYALGATAFECLVGSPPYQRDSDAAVLFAHLNDPVPKASVLRDALPPAVDAVVARALAKEPGERFETASDFVTALRRALHTRGPEENAGSLPPANASRP